MNRLLPLDNPIREYAWGSRTHLARLLGQPEPSPVPQAELWMGAHPLAPSCVGGRSLAELIAEAPEPMLGPAALARFGPRLPFLLKLLAVGAPLSIHAHPDREQALAGFARENAAGIPLDAPQRNYKDDSHKPELLCALGRFEALLGFRPIPEMLGLLVELALPELAPGLAHFRAAPHVHGLREFFRSLFELPPERRRRLLDQLSAVAGLRRDESPELRWVTTLAEQHPGDIGVLAPLLLNRVELQPGEAIYCPAGELHAYLDGFGVELMASSDNVLRGGLTPKHVDVPELLQTLSFADGPPRILRPDGRRYATPAEEFELSIVEVRPGEQQLATGRGGLEILVNVRGAATVTHTGTGERLELPQGSAAASPAAVAGYAVAGDATLYRAGIGRP